MQPRSAFFEFVIVRQVIYIPRCILGYNIALYDPPVGEEVELTVLLT